MATDNAAANAQLQGMIERLRALPTELVRTSAPHIAARGVEYMRRGIAAQVGPDGEPWPPTQTGKPALVNAAKALSTHVEDTRIVWTLTGPEALHNNGRVRGGERRQILPSRRLPQPLSRAIQAVLGDHFRDLVSP